MRALDGLPSSVSAIEAVRVAVEAAASLMHGRRALADARRRIVVAHLDLQERELIKHATLTNALARALGKRGLSESPASLAADMGMGVFYVGFTEWLEGPEEREFIEVVRDVFDRLKAVASGI